MEYERKNRRSGDKKIRFEMRMSNDDIEKLNGYSIEEILKIMQTFWEERDKNSSWIQFCSF